MEAWLLRCPMSRMSTRLLSLHLAPRDLTDSVTDLTTYSSLSLSHCRSCMTYFSHFYCSLSLSLSLSDSLITPPKFSVYSSTLYGTDCNILESSSWFSNCLTPKTVASSFVPHLLRHPYFRQIFVSLQNYKLIWRKYLSTKIINFDYTFICEL